VKSIFRLSQIGQKQNGSNKKNTESRKKIPLYLPKLGWVIIFVLFGLSFLIFENRLFSSFFGQVFLAVFILTILVWSGGAVNRYKLWKVRMHKNNKPIKLWNWFRF
jgi:hypothetical protein